LLLVLCCLIALLSISSWAADTDAKAYYHLLILGDPHLPGRNIVGKENVIHRINSWDDVDTVIAVGDICEDLGTEDEYAAAKTFFGKLNKPLLAIAGNHDYIYSSVRTPEGRRTRGKAVSREAKLRKFCETFKLPSIYYSQRAGRYLLIFLSPDSSGHLTEMSARQIGWLRSELERDKNSPTILFFHAPLKGTLRGYNSLVNTPDYIAQPYDKIHEILMQYPQVFAWVSGHTHTSPTEESYASPVNVYANRVTNIHNTDMNRELIWTNSLFLYHDKILVKTYQHKEGNWLPEIERTILLP
jgi:3',5'-cyclic AMP phosphodiesterase CpdA